MRCQSEAGVNGHSGSSVAIMAGPGASAECPYSSLEDGQASVLRLTHEEPAQGEQPALQCAGEVDPEQTALRWVTASQ